MNKNWPRWCIASIQTYLDENKEDYDLYFDGDIIKYDDLDLWIKCKISGPEDTHRSSTYHDLVFQVTLYIGMKRSYIYKHALLDACGHFAALLKEVPVYRYGSFDNVENTNEHIGCLKPLDGIIEIRNYGDVIPNHTILEATVETLLAISLEE